MPRTYAQKSDDFCGAVEICLIVLYAFRLSSKVLRQLSFFLNLVGFFDVRVLFLKKKSSFFMLVKSISKDNLLPEPINYSKTSFHMGIHNELIG